MLLENEIELSQFQKVLFELDDMETVNDLQSVYSTEMRNNDDMRSHNRLMGDNLSGGIGSGAAKSRPASGCGLNHSHARAVDPFNPIVHDSTMAMRHQTDDRHAHLDDSTYLRSEKKPPRHTQHSSMPNYP